MKRPGPWAAVFALAAAGAGAACSGKVSGEPPGGGPGPPGSGGSGAPIDLRPQPDSQGNLPYVAPRPAAAALPARVWRLTHLEYARSISAVLGVIVDTSDFEAENDSGSFQNVSNVGFVRTLLASSYYRVAEQAALAMTEGDLRALAGPSAACATLTAACKADFIRAAASRAFRRPASSEDMTELGEIFDLAVPSGDALLPFRSVVQVLLTSPAFLYRTEVGAPADAGKPAFRITDHEVASLLSYSLLRQPPSPSLLAAADRGELHDAASLGREVEALLAAPDAAGPLAAFLGQWLTLNRFNDDLYKFPNLFPNFDSVRAPMLDEAYGFLTSSGGMGATLSGLLTTPVPVAPGALGAFYASPGAGAGTRTGWLALGAFLSVAAHSDIGSPTLRGLFIRDRMLCQKFVVPQVVPALSDVETMGGAPKSTRDLYVMHKVDAQCARCHDALDPVGFTFESFDGAGRYRAEELFRNQTAPVPVDTSGRLINTDVNRELANHTDLAQALAGSAWVRECAAIQAFRYYFGFGADVPRGLPPVMAGYRALAAGGTMKDLVAAVMTSPSTVERARD
jgi:hypothetical protein